MRNAKIEFNMTVTLILVLVITLILLLVLGGIIGVYAQSSDTVECLWSQTLRNIPGGTLAFDLNCPRRFIAVTDEPLQLQYTLLGNRIGQSAPYTFAYYDEGISARNRVQTSDELAGLVAFEMDRCWELFDRGGSDTLSSHANVFALNKNTCIICSEIATSTNVPQAEKSFREYLQETPSRFGESYAQTLYTELALSKPFSCLQDLEEADTISQEDLYLSGQQHYVVASVRTGSSKIGARAAQFFTGNENAGWCQTTIVVPVEELATTCDAILN